ncbi:MAG: hypothetical protein ACRYG7_11770 [Janthinobacterium lividum]
MGRGAPVQRVSWRGKRPLPSASDWPGERAGYRLATDYWDGYYAYQGLPAPPGANGVAVQQPT